MIILNENALSFSTSIESNVDNNNLIPICASNGSEMNDLEDSMLFMKFELFLRASVEEFDRILMRDECFWVLLSACDNFFCLFVCCGL